MSPSGCSDERAQVDGAEHGDGEREEERGQVIAAVRTLSTVRPPADAYLLVEGDRPRDHLATLFLALAVAVFGVVNLGAFAREIRR